MTRMFGRPNLQEWLNWLVTLTCNFVLLYQLGFPDNHTFSTPPVPGGQCPCRRIKDPMGSRFRLIYGPFKVAGDEIQALSFGGDHRLLGGQNVWCLSVFGGGELWSSQAPGINGR